MSHNQLVGPAREVYKKLPSTMRHTVDDYLSDRPNKVLYDRFEVVDAWLEYTGIIGYGEDIRILFEAVK